MRLVDTHCHLQDAAFDADRESVLQRALDVLEWLVVVGDEVGSSRAALAMVRERVYATVGVHPHNAASADVATWATLRALAREPCVVAWGEMGLDYHYEFAPRQDQREALERQLDAAVDLGLPVVIHCREAQEDLTAIVEPISGRLAGGVMHCFDGDGRFAERCLAWGFHISFAGNITYPKSHHLRDAARAVPLDRLLVETDSPYLPPQAIRGTRRNEPGSVVLIADALADLRGVAREELAEWTTRNAERLFLNRAARRNGS